MDLRSWHNIVRLNVMVCQLLAAAESVWITLHLRIGFAGSVASFFFGVCACNYVAQSKRQVVCTTYDNLEATSFHINGWTWLDVACLRSTLVKDRWSKRIVLLQHSGKLARKELRGSDASVKIFQRRARSAKRQDHPSFQSVCAWVLSDIGCWQLGRTSRFHACPRDGVWVWPVYGARTYWKFGDSVPTLK